MMAEATFPKKQATVLIDYQEEDTTELKKRFESLFGPISTIRKAGPVYTFVCFHDNETALKCVQGLKNEPIYNARFPREKPFNKSKNEEKKQFNNSSTFSPGDQKHFNNFDNSRERKHFNNFDNSRERKPFNNMSNGRFSAEKKYNKPNLSDRIRKPFSNLDKTNKEDTTKDMSPSDVRNVNDHGPSSNISQNSFIELEENKSQDGSNNHLDSEISFVSIQRSSIGNVQNLESSEHLGIGKSNSTQEIEDIPDTETETPSFQETPVSEIEISCLTCGQVIKGSKKQDKKGRQLILIQDYKDYEYLKLKGIGVMVGVVVANFPIYFMQCDLYDLCRPFVKVLQVNMRNDMVPTQIPYAYVFVGSEEKASQLVKSVNGLICNGKKIYAFKVSDYAGPDDIVNPEPLV